MSSDGDGMNEKQLQRAVSSRRRFVKAVGGAAVNAAVLRGGALAQVNEQPDATIAATTSTAKAVNRVLAVNCRRWLQERSGPLLQNSTNRL